MSDKWISLDFTVWAAKGTHRMEEVNLKFRWPRHQELEARRLKQTSEPGRDSNFEFQDATSTSVPSSIKPKSE